MGERIDDGARAPSEAETPKLIYIMGAGRSGSTILGVALGNCDGVFFAGELNQWLARSGKPALVDAERTRFWAAVRERAEIDGELFGNATRALERSSSLFRREKRKTRRALRSCYQAASAELVRAIQETSGVDRIVDSSHYPLRARELESASGIELYLLFLVRDPQRIVASLDRDDVAERRFDALSANAYMWLTYLLSLVVFLRHPRRRRLFVRHEDLLAAPAEVLTAILRLTGSPAALPDFGSLETGVPFHGNRLIRSPSIALAPAGPRPAVSLITAVLQAPWSLVFARLRPAVVDDALADDRS